MVRKHYLILIIIVALTLVNFSCKQAKQKPITQEKALSIADKIAERQLEEFNQKKLAETLGGPFFFEDYEKEIVRDTFEDRQLFVVNYKYKNPVDFRGYPQHFSVWVYTDNGEIKFYGGR